MRKVPFVVIIALAGFGLFLSLYMEAIGSAIPLARTTSTLVGVVGYGTILILSFLKLLRPDSKYRFGAAVFYVALFGAAVTAWMLLMELEEARYCHTCVLQLVIIFSILFSCIAGLRIVPWERRAE
ncbi:hypothetical protein J4439_00390 [Candidatus Woesearchaeota archaeon]|nr:hypothetical protein [Candidatus Woesearchaeota archaeon]